MTAVGAWLLVAACGTPAGRRGGVVPSLSTVASDAIHGLELGGQTVSVAVPLEFHATEPLGEVHFHVGDAASPAGVARASPFRRVLDATRSEGGHHRAVVRATDAAEDGDRLLSGAVFHVANRRGETTSPGGFWRRRGSVGGRTRAR